MQQATSEGKMPWANLMKEAEKKLLDNLPTSA